MASTNQCCSAANQHIFIDVLDTNQARAQEAVSVVYTVYWIDVLQVV